MAKLEYVADPVASGHGVVVIRRFLRYGPAMSRELIVHLLPTHFEPSTLRGGLAVVIDILRATTTMTHALANGAERIIPCESIKDARAVQSELGEACLLGGERGGERIDGFDLGNSPASYSPAAVAGRTVALTTTNGTRALLKCSEACRVLAGAFVNLDSVVRLLEASDRPVHLVCAGTDGFVSTEDSLFAGAVCDMLSSHGEYAFNDSAMLARHHWIHCSKSEDSLFEAILCGRGGQNVNRLGLIEDIRVASSRNRFREVPEWHPRRGFISLATDCS